MDQELAQMVTMTASRARVALGDLMVLLKDHGDDEKDGPVKLAIAAAIYEIGSIEDYVFKEHPRLKVEFDARLDKYGRSYY